MKSQETVNYEYLESQVGKAKLFTTPQEIQSHILLAILKKNKEMNDNLTKIIEILNKEG